MESPSSYCQRLHGTPKMGCAKHINSPCSRKCLSIFSICSSSETWMSDGIFACKTIAD